MWTCWSSWILFFHVTETFLSLQLNKDWFFPAEVSLKKRDHIRKVIHRIVENNALKDPPATSNKCYQSGASDGDSGAKIVQQNGAEELCPCIKFDCCDDFDNEEQQSFTAMSEHSRNNDKSVICESSQPCKLVMPINQFNNMSMPMEVTASWTIINNLCIQKSERRSVYNNPQFHMFACFLSFPLQYEVQNICCCYNAPREILILCLLYLKTGSAWETSHFSTWRNNIWKPV